MAKFSCKYTVNHNHSIVSTQNIILNTTYSDTCNSNIYLLQNGSDVPLERVAIRFLASRTRTSNAPLAGMPGFLENLRLVTSGGTYFKARIRSPL